MAPIVIFRRGDSFEDQSDLIVLPCDTYGEVTHFVAERLEQYKISVPKGQYALGKVVFLPYDNKMLTAKYIAFAATVSGDDSPTTAEVIKTIGNSLGEFTNKNPSILRVSAPLLGTDDGKLPIEIAYRALSESFKSSANSRAMLTISVMQAEMFRDLESMRWNNDGGTLK
ncbi:MAG: hypothetical protein NTU95_03050 [Methanothrix sp.]|nr:hypothetical protein [Methanothrix sp.]